MGAMLAKRAQRDSKHVRRQIMRTASVGMAPTLPELRKIHTVISETLRECLPRLRFGLVLCDPRLLTYSRRSCLSTQALVLDISAGSALMCSMMQFNGRWSLRSSETSSG